MLELVLCTNIGKATTSAVLKEENQERNMRGLKKKHKMDGGWLAALLRWPREKLSSFANQILRRKAVHRYHIITIIPFRLTS